MRGSLTAVIGPNGAGKSSLMAAMAGQVPLATGAVRFAERLGGHVAYLPQMSEIDRGFPVKVIDVVMLGAWRGIRSFRAANSQVRHQALQALNTVGLTGFEHRLIGELSVGQFQRVLFARLLLQDASLILLDEPFNAIDARTTADLLALVHRWHGEGRTVIAVLHDMAQVQEHFPQALLLAREAVAWGPTPATLSLPNQRRARQMSESWDEHAPLCEPGGSSHGPALGHDHGHGHGHGHDHHHRHEGEPEVAAHGPDGRA
jgi:zinc/manganese transport system ATP-binding protein